jgi:hypothetical protein
MIQKILFVGTLILITNLIWASAVDMKTIYHHFQKAHLEKEF